MSSACWNPPSVFDDGRRPFVGEPADWQALLPPHLLALVVHPVRSEAFRDDELPAERALGYDLRGEPCFCVCRHVLSELDAGGDEERLHESPVLSECLTAWRLRDGGWLVHRSVRRFGLCGAAAYEFFQLSETLPR